MPSLYGRSKVVVRQGDDYVSVFAKNNTTYIINEFIDLGGEKVVIGAESVLFFKGGCLANGTIVGNNTRVKADNYEIFKRGYTRYRAYMNPGSSERFPPSLKRVYHDWLLIEGTWANKRCCSKWTGLLNKSNEDVMLAVKNYVTLHASGAKVIMPSIEALGYDQTKFPGNHIIDFNNSVISYPDTLSKWEDKTITLPKGATPCEMESGYGLITVNHNTIITNLSVDGKSVFRQNETKRLGVSNIICIGNSQNVTLENISLCNVLGPAMVAHSKAKDILFKNCKFTNIEEHVLYSQQYLGFCKFDFCVFDRWDSERLSVFRNGLNYIYKHTPPIENEDAKYEDLYSFELTFNGCVFNNPKRVNSQGRTLGGFITGSFPVLIKVENCTFNGEPPVLNPGGGSFISDKTKKAFRMIVRNGIGAPVVYPSRSNFNIITEFYNCKEVPFRAVYAKRYERCDLYVDLYEDNIENVSSSYEDEFSTPLVIKDCKFKDRGNKVMINHPLYHRPVIFENCEFVSDINRDEISDIVTVKAEGFSNISFLECRFNMPNFRLIGGNLPVSHLSISQCSFISISQSLYDVIPQELDVKDTLF